ncbi:unnamed protein product, partial [Amoebophrya sp. A120]|eukprot:GSA120T00015890001.1
MLRVDVQAARRIYDHMNAKKNISCSSVIELFLSFPEVIPGAEDSDQVAMNSTALLTSLRMLEEATWALDPHPGSSSTTSTLHSQST